MNLGFSEKLLFNTIHIIAVDESDNSVTGTAFLFEYEINGGVMPCLVTNKHVVEGTVKGTLFFHTQKDGEPDYKNHHQVVFHEFEHGWIGHPDLEIDLCIMPIAGIIREAYEMGVDLLLIYMDETSILSSENLDVLDAVDDIVMVGYPNGLWDDVHNLPLIRRGTTATHPNIDYQNKKEFLIDAACFPGSSGSPVIYYKPGGTIRLKHDDRPRQGNHMALMGILYAGPMFDAEGEIVIQKIPTRKVGYASTAIPLNLGFVIKASRLLEFKPEIEKLLLAPNE